MVTIQDSVKKYFKDLSNGCNNLIDCENLYKKIGAKEDLFILDVRKKEDFAKNHIEGSFNCEWVEVIEFIEEDIFPRDKKIIITCYTGQTSGQIVAILKLLGYDACSLRGGIDNGWMKDSMPVESTCST